MIKSGTLSHLPTQQPSVVPTLPPASIPSKKPSNIPSSGPSAHPSDSPSVAMSVNPSPLPSITPTTFTLDVRSDKLSGNPNIHLLQAPTGAIMYKNYAESLQEAGDFNKICIKILVILQLSTII